MWEIRGKYMGNPWETIDTADSEREAITLTEEYRMAFGQHWIIKYRKAR